MTSGPLTPNTTGGGGATTDTFNITWSLATTGGRAFISSMLLPNATNYSLAGVTTTVNSSGEVNVEVRWWLKTSCVALPALKAIACLN
jgi:hypothetical protein